MSRPTLVWTLLFCFGALGLVHRAVIRPHGMGRVYVREVAMAPDARGQARTKFVECNAVEPAAIVSLPRTAGLWLAAFFTLAVFSFLYRDNVFYKLSEAIFVGVSAGWVMAQGFWDGIVRKLLARLAPDAMRAWALPDLPRSEYAAPDWWYLCPLVLGLMLLWRLAPRSGWIARWPLAFVVGTFAGLKLVNFLDADFVNQIRSTIVPLIVLREGRLDPWASLRHVGLVVGVLSSLTYFFFSVEHKGVVGGVARVGIWFLMVTFGASFAFTVMGRIALLAARVEFLLDDWLWLIDPTDKRPPGW